MTGLLYVLISSRTAAASYLHTCQPPVRLSYPVLPALDRRGPKLTRSWLSVTHARARLAIRGDSSGARGSLGRTVEYLTT